MPIDPGTATILSTGMNIAANEWMRGSANDDARKAAQKAWQRSKTAAKHKYRWAMEDMQKAGLNPILAAGSSGFSVGGSPQAQQAQLNSPQYIDVASTAKNTAEAFQAEAETEKVQEETQLVIQQKFHEIQKAKETIQKTLESRARTMESGAKAHLAFTQEEKTWNEALQIEKNFEIQAKQLAVMHAQIGELESRSNYEQQQREESIAREKEINAKTALVEKQAKELYYKLSQLQKKHRLYKGPIGQLLTNVKEILESLRINFSVTAIR